MHMSYVRETSAGYLTNWAARLFARAIERRLAGGNSGPMPVFFALAGLKNASGMFNADALDILALVLVTAVVGKMAGAYIGAKFAGYPSRVALSLGALMNARGLMELVVIKIGLDAGLIESRLFTIFLVMTIVTTMMAGPLLTLLGRKSADEVPGNEEPVSSL